MAYFRSGTGGGGGGETETTLWTNPSPSATFNAQDVTLSQAYTNFAKLRFYYSGSANQDEQYVEYSKENINKWLYTSESVPSGQTRLVGSLGSYYRNQNAFYQRTIRKSSSSTTTQFWISLAFNSNGGTASPGIAIPIKITGII